MSRRASSRVRPPDEPGPSASSNSITSDTSPPPLHPALPPHIHSSGSDSDQAKVDRVIHTVPRAHRKLHTLRTNFIFPTRLDFPPPSNADSHTSNSTDEDNDWHIAAYLPTTSVNATVRGLLRQLDRVDGKTTRKRCRRRRR